VSILKNPITYPIGTVGSITQLFFASNPMYCQLGDLIAPVILQADVAAMDGVLDVVMFA
jgi:hypothetical protein